MSRLTRSLSSYPSLPEHSYPPIRNRCGSPAQATVPSEPQSARGGPGNRESDACAGFLTTYHRELFSHADFYLRLGPRPSGQQTMSLVSGKSHRIQFLGQAGSRAKSALQAVNHRNHQDCHLPITLLVSIGLIQWSSIEETVVPILYQRPQVRLMESVLGYGPSMIVFKSMPSQEFVHRYELS